MTTTPNPTIEASYELAHDTLVSLAVGALVLIVLSVKVVLWHPDYTTLAGLVASAVVEILALLTCGSALLHRWYRFPGIAQLSQAPTKHLVLALGAGLLLALLIAAVLHQMALKGMPLPPAGVTAGLLLVLVSWLTLPQCWALMAQLRAQRSA